MNTSFCTECGAYLRPDQSEIAWTAPGKAAAVCRDCKRLIYQGRIDTAMESLTPPPTMPLFTMNGS
jgi:hypothetical protein